MKKTILFIMLFLFMAVNVTAMTIGGIDPVKTIGFEKTE